MKPQPYKVAAVQIAPVFLNREATVDKALKYLGEATQAGAKLVVFPEVLVPGYPDWVWTVPAREDLLDDLYGELLENSVEIPGDTTRRLCEAAREARAFIVIGVNERNTEASGGSLYNTLLFINPEGKLVGRHRKLIPTGGERLMWGQGDGSTLQVYDTPIGKMSGLICWENYMPLARYAMYALGIPHPRRLHVGPRRALALDRAAHRQGRTRVGDQLLPGVPPERHSRSARTQALLPGGSHVDQRGRQRDHRSRGPVRRGAAPREGRHPLRRDRPAHAVGPALDARRRGSLRAAGRVPAIGRETGEGDDRGAGGEGGGGRQGRRRSGPQPKPRATRARPTRSHTGKKTRR